MFYGPSDCPFMRRLEDAFEVVREECERVPRAAYRLWPIAAAYTGAWRIFPFLSADPSWHLAELSRQNGALVPRTLELVRSIPGALLAGFSILDDGSHVYPHEDEVVCETVRCHLALRVDGPAGLRMGSEVRHHSQGRCLGFDSAAPHESFNLSGADRVVLLVDVDRRHAG